MLRLSRSEVAKDLAQRALRAVAGFAKLKLKFQDLEVGLDFEPEPGLADDGDLEIDLSALLEAVGRAAKAGETAVVLFVDELQYGYAYFVQEWGKHTWDAAQQSPITRADVVNGSILATASLDASFFRVRFDRLTPGEKRYLRAMAELGPGPHRAGRSPKCSASG